MMHPLDAFVYKQQWSFCVPTFDAQKKLFFSAPTKFVPLTDQIIEDEPRLEIRRSIAIKL